MLENLSLFENQMEGQVPDLEKLNNLKENISYNKFSGLISRKLAVLDALNMTMLNDKGMAVLNVAMDIERPLVSEGSILKILVVTQ
jgi:hypothetical protein